MNQRLLLIAFTLVAVPLGWAFELIAIAPNMPHNFQVLRKLLEEYVTPIAYGAGVLALIAGLIAWRWFTPLAQRRQARLTENAEIDKNDQHALHERAAVESFLITSSLVQLVAIFGIVLSLIGAKALPVAIAMVIVGCFVCLLGYKCWRY